MLVNTRLWVAGLFVVSVFVVPSSVSAQIPGSFSTTWDTTLPGGSTNTQVTIPYLGQAGELEVYWEDVSSSTINGTTTVDFFSNRITFPAEGVYRIDITAPFNYSLAFYVGGDAEKLLTVEQWGDNQWPSMANMFDRASNLTSVPEVEAPDTSAVVDMSQMFAAATSFDSPIDHWDVSGVTNMTSMFSNASSFNQPLNNWDVSSVTDMPSMFVAASSFNQLLNNWDTSSVTNMTAIFGGASSFDQSLGEWDITAIAVQGEEGTGLDSVLSNTNIGVVNYSATLAGWSQSSVILSAVDLGVIGPNVGRGASDTQYFSTVQAARDILTGDNVWNIVDGGPLPAFLLTYGTTVNASLTGEGNQTVASGTPGTAVTVVPNSGYEFVQWSDGNTDNPRTDTPTTASVSVIAEVAKIEASSGGSSGTRVGARQSDLIDVETKPESTNRDLITSEGISILNLSPEELQDLPDDQKRQVIDILLKLIAILTEVLTQMMVGEGA